MEVRETATLSERATAAVKTTGKMLVQFISPGWGTSGYYSPDVLQEAAANRVIPAGTHMYADHPTAEDRKTRPERSIRDLMAVTTGDAQLAANGALIGEVRVLAPYADLIADLKDHIGVSILGDATDIYEGEADGRKGRIIAGLDKVHSVDFVTRAGRGGQVLSLLESAALAEHDPTLTVADLEERDFSGQQRQKMADKGTAMSDGSFPIANTEDLHNAIQAVGRAKDPEAAKRHIIARARKLGAVGSLPKDWGVKESDLTAYLATLCEADGMIPALEDLLCEAILLEDDMDPELREVITSGKGAEGTAKLHAYWRHGEGAAKIRWGVAGDFQRCVDHLSKYVRDPKGYCAKMHKDVTGATPGHAAEESAVNEDDRVLELLESGLAVDQDGHTYALRESGWAPVAPEPRERVITVLESGLGLDEEGHTYQLEESGWQPVLEAEKRVYHWKHGWIPLDHAAAKDIAPAGTTKKAPIPGNKYSEFPKIYSDTTLSSLVAHREKLVSSQAANKRDNPRYKAEIRRLDKAIADRRTKKTASSQRTANDAEVAKLSIGKRREYANHRAAGLSHEDAMKAVQGGQQQTTPQGAEHPSLRNPAAASAVKRPDDHSDFSKMSDSDLSAAISRAEKSDSPAVKKMLAGLRSEQAKRKGTFNKGPGSANSSNTDDKALDDRISKLEARKAELSKLPSARASRSAVSDQIRDLNRQIAQLHTRKKNK